MRYKELEITNHLGSVITTLSDRRLAIQSSGSPTAVEYYFPNMLSTSDYYAYGMQQPERNYSSSYRYGFNKGSEKDDEISNVQGANLTTEFREIDTRLGRMWSRDPIVKSWESPYAAFANNPIIYNDPAGADVGERLKNAAKNIKTFIRNIGKNKFNKQKYTHNNVPQHSEDNNSEPNEGESDEPSKKRNTRFVIEYYATPVATVLGSNQPVTFHNTGLFSHNPPYIKFSEPATQMKAMFIVPSKNPSIEYGYGLFDFHLKPNAFASGLYLANGYTQVSPGFSIFHRPNATGRFSGEATIAAGFMFSDPDFRYNPNKTYLPYFKITKGLKNEYQVTGYGGTITGAISFEFIKNWSVSFGVTIHGDISRPLRATDGTTERLSTIDATIVGGLKINIR